MVVPKGINSLDTSGTVLRCDFIQPVEQRQDSVGCYPGLAELPRHIVLLAEGVDQPVGHGVLLLSPGRERKHHWDGLLWVLGGTHEQLPRERQEQRRLAGPWRTEDEQGAVKAIKEV